MNVTPRDAQRRILLHLHFDFLAQARFLRRFGIALTRHRLREDVQAMERAYDREFLRQLGIAGE